MSAPQKTAIDPTWTWGSSATLKITNTGAASVSAQLAQVTLPEPAVCSVYLQASARITNPENISVATFTINLTQGLGRVSIPRQISFAGQPALDAPLEFTIPFIPLHALQVDVEAQAEFRVENPGEIEIQIYFVLAPITRIPQKQQELKFGMALPGEADDLDDELRQDLEAEGPTAAAAVMEGRQQVDGSDDHMEEGEDEDEDEGEGPPQAQRPPAWVVAVKNQLERRYGREPTLPELRAAVMRTRARRARMRSRGR